jgi:hypothetical protein
MDESMNYTTNKTAPGTSEGISILKKGFFLILIMGCVVIYLRMSKVKEQDTQGYEKILA